MPPQATTADAQLILQLYELRREAEMRKARHWFAATFSPQSYEDIQKVIAGPPQESAWFRQVLSYWEMAVSLVNHGALNEELFFDTNGELWFVLGKILPFLAQYREKTSNPNAFKIVEGLATKTEAGRKRLEHMVKMHEARRKAG
ncbi:MAG TPA: hypothetical protein VH088_22900 [Terriglobales bacterium]|nr:hypothetical protein [Terriglobales bacterium]